jgi:hypothetical protein
LLPTITKEIFGVTACSLQTKLTTKSASFSIEKPVPPTSSNTCTMNLLLERIIKKIN